LSIFNKLCRIVNKLRSNNNDLLVQANSNINALSIAVCRDLVFMSMDFHRAVLGQRKVVVKLLGAAGTENIASLPESHDHDYKESAKKVKELAGKAFSLWLQCQEAGEKTYEQEPIQNLAIEGHRSVGMFDSFVSCYLKGNILDIGCGPQRLPYYLKNYPLEHIAGIDPIGEPKDRDFKFIKGFAEFLPWDDNSFDRVIVSTSLDHMIHLEKALDEIYRVLKKDGLFITWLGFVPGAKKYDPYAADLEKIDDCHIYHFDRFWFESMMKEKFEIYEDYEIYHHDRKAVLDCFYAFKKK
jgi:SAM-dependent methyltransferase